MTSISNIIPSLYEPGDIHLQASVIIAESFCIEFSSIFLCAEAKVRLFEL